MTEQHDALNHRCWRCQLQLVLEASGSGYVVVLCKRCKARNVVHLVAHVEVTA